MLNKILVLLVLVGFSCAASAQVSVQFIPEVYGRNLSGLLNAGILNTGGKMNVRLSITVTEEKAGKVISILTQPFVIVPGSNMVPASAAKSASVQLSNNKVSRFIQQNSAFPQGNYEYSYKVISAISVEEIIIDQTFEQEVLPPAPLDLIEPYNEDKICNKQPLLTWQPSIPTIPGTMYELLMVEMKDRQSAVEALNYNLPIVKQKGIVNTMLLYPPASKALTEGKKYAWQVTAYKDQTVINRSEVWEFTLDCKEEKEVVEDDNGYRDIEDLFRGNFYVARGVVKFSMVNSYNEQPLKYSIICVTDPLQKPKRLPKIQLKKGQNKLRIDLSQNYSFKDGYSYLLEVQMPGGTPKKMRFIYNNIE
jgi:hypothetical protein